MKIIGLDGKEYKWMMKGCKPKESSFHITVRKILKDLYPLDRILEEVPLPGSHGLSCDFYLPSRKKMIECNGRQHYEYTGHFHRTKMNFYRGKANDRNKQKWCELNGITLISLTYKGSEGVWRRQISEG